MFAPTARRFEVHNDTSQSNLLLTFVSLRYLDDVVFDFVFDIVFDFVSVFRFLDEGGGGVSYDAREARR